MLHPASEMMEAFIEDAKLSQEVAEDLRSSFVAVINRMPLSDFVAFMEEWLQALRSLVKHGP